MSVKDFYECLYKFKIPDFIIDIEAKNKNLKQVLFLKGNKFPIDKCDADDKYPFHYWGHIELIDKKTMYVDREMFKAGLRTNIVITKQFQANQNEFALCNKDEMFLALAAMSLFTAIY